MTSLEEFNKGLSYIRRLTGTDPEVGVLFGDNDESPKIVRVLNTDNGLTSFKLMIGWHCPRLGEFPHVRIPDIIAHGVLVAPNGYIYYSKGGRSSERLVDFNYQEENTMDDLMTRIQRICRSYAGTGSGVKVLFDSTDLPPVSTGDRAKGKLIGNKWVTLCPSTYIVLTGMYWPGIYPLINSCPTTKESMLKHCVDRRSYTREGREELKQQKTISRAIKIS